MCMPSFILIGCCVSELHGHLCPYRNVLPEAVYCCFTRTILFTELFTCLYDHSWRFLSRHQVSLLYTFWFLRYLNVLPEAVYFCFTRTTLFTTMFTVIIVECLLKRMCMPSFILIGCCVSELHGHLCPYRNVLPEAVYCCFTRTTLFTELFTCLYDHSWRFLSRHQVSLLYTFWFLR